MPSIIPSPGTPGINPNLDASIWVQGNYNIDAATAYYMTSTYTMFTSGDPMIVFTTFVNNGTLWNKSDGARVIGSQNFGAIVNNGLIVAEAAVQAYAIDVWSSFHGLVNTGRIFALAVAEQAVAVSDYGGYMTEIVNSGIIAARSNQMAGIALYRNNGGRVENSITGQILAEGAYATAIILGRGHRTAPGFPEEADVDNAGLIEAASTNPAHASIGLSLGSLDLETMTVLNSGTIRADIAISMSNGGVSGDIQGVKMVTNLAGGLIDGDIYLDILDEVVINQGQIVGDVAMFEGQDRFDNSAGQLSGLVDMGWGGDLYIGGAGLDAVIGERGDDDLRGNGGNDLLLGGRGNDLLTGGGGNDGLYGEAGNDRIVTAGGDRVLAGLGDDVVTLGDYSFEKVDGGAGRDVLVLAEGPRNLDLAAALATGRIAGFEEIRLSGAQHLVVRAADVALISGGGSELRISASAAGAVDLVGGWAAQGPQTIGGVQYRAYTSGGTTVLIESVAAISVLASAPGGATGLDAIAGGGAAPVPGAVPGADLAASTTATDGHFSIYGPLTVDADEHWTLQSSALAGAGWVINGGNYEAVLVNYGTIGAVGGDPGLGGIAFLFSRLENYGTIDISAHGSAEYAAHLSQFNTYGIDISVMTLPGSVYGLACGGNGGYVLNAGTINVASESSIAAGYATYGLDMRNDGLVHVASSAFVAIGVHSHNGGHLVNNGTIEAEGQIGAYGVRTMTHVALIENHGLISANAVQAGKPEIAVSFYYSLGVSTLINTGTIRGEIAVQTSWMVNGGGLVLRNEEGGRIEGLVQLNLNPAGGPARQDVIYNDGIIVGAVQLGGERDIFFGDGGQVQGIVTGEAGSDLLFGSANADIFQGGDDGDLLYGGLGADSLSGGAGRDVFLYRSAAESLFATQDNITDFQGGQDRIDLSGLGVTSLTFGPVGGFTTVTAVTASGTLSIRVTGAISAADVITANIAQIDGTAAADTLVATNGGSRLIGLDGDDLLYGQAGNDRLEGGAGIDLLWGGKGDDLFIVGDAEDVVWELKGEGVDTIEFTSWSDAGLYSLPDNVENLVLVVGGTAGGNKLDNIITGNDGALNYLSGGAGNDILYGNGGWDFLNGGAGADRMTGGAGTDYFTYWAVADSRDDAIRSDGRKSMPDVIMDFTQGQDKIDLSAVDAKSATIWENDQFTFLGTGAFTGHAGELRYEAKGGQMHIYADVDGDSVADMHIIAITPALQASDFVL